ncbi:unnamed protein product [Phytomonas sp. EM1]|nr:unnamed protein product [Phytomonas sp. EM1]|eukprot:CCW60893.1 unnamed protein product [Phytomonas sp. isolate EM1]
MGCDASHALRISIASVKLSPPPPSDPLTEQGDWEDSSDGIGGAWKEDDQYGFAVAANSDEVRQAHFGPTWSRFTTVGRLALKKMKENNSNGDDPNVPGKVHYPTVEEMHARELNTKRKLMENNFESYEEYLAATYGGDHSKEDCTGEVPLHEKETSPTGGNGDVGLHTEAEMERAFSVVDGVDGLDRMAQRNLAREELVNLEATEDTEAVPLPNFMLIDTDDPKALEAAEVDSFRPPVRRASANRRGTCASDGSPDIPGSFQEAVIRALPGAHSDPRLPTEDPIHWGTDAILLFLELFEQLSDGDTTAARVATDGDMMNTFWMAKVDGKMLLNDVTPPRLFRVMRRWHVQRMNIVRAAFQSHDAPIPEVANAGGGSHPSNPEGYRYDATGVELSERTKEVIARLCRKLEEAVQPLDSEMIQETILLCFPYAR